VYEIWPGAMTTSRAWVMSFLDTKKRTWEQRLAINRPWHWDQLSQCRYGSDSTRKHYGFILEFSSCCWCNLEDKAVLQPHYKEKKALAPSTLLLGYNNSEPRLVHKRNRWWDKIGQSIRNTRKRQFSFDRKLYKLTKTILVQC